MENFQIPEFVPFIGDKDVVVKGELGLGTLGYKFHAGQETGAYVGGGLFVKFKKRGEEE
ncbi:hypothetical protein OF830_02765 [Bacillus paramycoides]|nr:hypothetical protein [Bacillus paramycoides]MCW9129899.1 hypothetical protein [Bacillus paramycoides]